ncbi:MAG: TlpA family protein disulfide reductase [Chloroflexi bacterium]|nr:TlpA family protein disulfide reductase [Chloroflexota bacterium]
MRRLLGRRAWLVGVAVTALVVAACGGGSGSSAPPASDGQGEVNAAQVQDLRLGPIDTPPVRDLKVGATVGRLAPNFRLERPDGGTVVLSDLRGKPIFLNFWATWCGPCRFEMPEIQAMHERLGDELVVLAVDKQESSGDVVNFFEELGLTFDAVIDDGNKVSAKYRLFGLPSTYIIDAEGVVQAVKVGPFANQDDLNNSLKKVGL